MALTDKLTAIADAIRAKDGSTATMTLAEMPSKIAAIQTGGGSSPASPKDVNFYDYDGTLVASYSLSEAQSLTALPDGPTHDSLTFQGWNYTLDKVKAFTRPTNVWAMYITDDGKTRLHIHIAAEGRMTVPLYFSQMVANGVTIDWGDGSATETLTGTGPVNTAHVYSRIGNYVISLDPADGCELGLGSDSSSYCVLGDTGNNGRVYCNFLQKVHIGANVTSIGDYAFNNCYSLASVTIPANVTSIGDYAFNNCYSLASITIPDSVTSIGSYVFSSCCSLANITIPNGVTSIGDYAFDHCYSLASITIPDSVTSIGSYVFSSCFSLANITIPNGVTSIGNNAFDYCYSLASITIPNGVTSIGNNAIRGCYSLAYITIPGSVISVGNGAFKLCYSLASITIPNSVTSIGTSALDSCYSLASITIPNSVTSIGSKGFSGCYSLASITIPNSVTSIGGYAFAGCTGMAAYHLKPTTPPTLSSTTAFNSIPSDCVIYVPKGCLEAYQNATNWATYASYMQEEPA